MPKFLKILIGAGMVVALGIFLVTWALPQAVAALPGPVRARLPEEVLRAVTAPLPTALPAPDQAVIGGEPAAALTAVAQAADTPLDSPQASPTRRAARPKATPTPQPSTPAAQSPPVSPTRPAQSPTPPPATSQPTPLPAFRLQGLAITPQKLNNCGPANLSIVLNYFGLETSQFDVAGAIKPHYEDRNVSPDELAGFALNQPGLGSAVYSGGDLDLLKRLIAAGYPVIIEKGYEPDDWQGWMGHYLTLYGYDEAEQIFWAMDTFLGPWDGSGLGVSYDQVAEQWTHFNNTFLIVYPLEEEAAVLEAVGPRFADPQTMWQQAAAAAQGLIDADPNNAFAWFNLGSSLTRASAFSQNKQEMAAAVLAFDQARRLGLPHRMLWYQFTPYEAYIATGRTADVLTLTQTILDNPGGKDVEETFYYRGLALRAAGEETEAVRSFRRALEIKPDYPAAAMALTPIP